MAEAIVCFVIDKLILLTAEAKLAIDSRSEVGFIRDELESIRSFLKDADAKAATKDDEMANDSIKTWVKQVREAAYCIEDIVDEYLLCVTRHDQDHGFFYFIPTVVWVLKKMRTKDDIVSKIDGMKTLVSEIKARYGFSSVDFGEKTLPWHDPRVASFFIEEAEVVGVESARDELIGRLVNEASRCEVISVVGMGGLGKTTFAEKVYGNQKVVAHYDCHAWITVVVKSKKGKTLMEEVGEEYLADLIHRNLVQVSKVYIDGKARSCRVHDLLHEVLRRKSAGSSFYPVLSEDESTFEPVTQRLSIDSSPSEALRSITQSHIRFVFTFNQAEWPKSFLNTWSGNSKLVKVLDFTDAPLSHLPKYMGYLYLLKYLSLRNTKVKLLPEFIGNLQNLENLGSKTVSGVKIDDGIGCVQALQKVKANHGGINLIKALGKLRQLIKLNIFWSRLRDSPLKALQNLPNVFELGLSYKAHGGVELHFEKGFTKLEVLQLRDLEGLNSLVIDNGAMPLLRELQIGPSPQAKEMPSSIHHLPNLTTLRFVN
ncbi:late blight resistance protein-like protein R1B-16 [Pyrus ussuriensis x Pyrus communis]|uniref:Late blight resistance protein-like protein R1B-16 n=1 Tax=Pyrus ussuriensis x Pyrus communis TaxID=2448454 RepID=A0A5N5HFC8_9ROSA|nr:late blight resistance protein-like protein R1B-16 [Pyrus ussuriensis x Pyrus communis]